MDIKNTKTNKETLLKKEVLQNYCHEFSIKRMYWLVNHRLPLIFVVCGILLRAFGLLRSSLWYDESLSLAMVRMPLFEMVQLSASDFNPPLWEILIWPIVRLVGFTTLGLRLFAFLSGSLALVFVYILARNYCRTHFQLLLTMCLASFMPMSIWAAQDGRIYALLSLLFLLGFYFAKDQRWLGLFATCGLILYAHGTGPFLVAGLLVVSLVTNPANFRKTLLIGTAAIICWLPWLATTLNVVNNDLLLSFSFVDLLTQFAGAFWGPTTPGFSLFLAVLLIFVTLLCSWVIWIIRGFSSKQWNSFEQLIFLVVWVPLGLMILVSAFIKPFLFYRPLTPLVMPICLMVGTFQIEKKRNIIQSVIMIAWIPLLIYSLSQWSPEIKGGGIDKAAQMINQSYKPGEVIYNATGTSWLPFTYYLDPHIQQEIMELPQSPSLLRQELGLAFGAEYTPLPAHQAAWIIYARDPLISLEGKQRMDGLIKEAQLITVVRGWQFSTIEIWYRSSK